MLRYLFSVYDSKANAFMSAFSLASEGVAARWFADCVNGGVEQFSRHPEDYTLFCLGLFDEDTGAIEGFGAPKSVCTGISVRKES